eukprot:TRINITY_DN102663_c0_g1_i1.p2 TRINITY_DN102663_c0_g1~~TRINITY_DN102663_c0_g1_i1.p2  ORF type:complete len:477 (-),score=132.64 TRINITY_DN102663_c0_g1_i1:114-1544(-)
MVQQDLASPLHASRQSLDTLQSAAYWRKLCPKLHVDDSALQSKTLASTNLGTAKRRMAASAATCSEVRGRIIEEGFAALQPSALNWSVNVADLAEGVKQLQQYGWPPSFIAMYDEAWIMGLDAASVMETATGNTMCMDIVGFLVDPKMTKGFSPHRDRQPEDWMPRGVPESVPGTFKPDGIAKYITIWVALTDANVDNSCLHYIPRSCDPGYSEGDPEDADPLARCFAEKAAYQNIRAAPVGAGGCTFHTHRTIHWGNSGRPSYVGEPRVALSFGFSCPDFEPPYFSPKSLPFPAVALRAALASAQVLNYATLAIGDAKGWVALAGSMAGCTSSQLTMLHRLFKKHSKSFHATYKTEIAHKFVKVSLDMSKGTSLIDTSADPEDAADVPASKIPAQAREADGDDSDDDDALEAMLDAEAMSGQVMFHDDFDMMNTGDDFAAADLRGKCKRKGKKKAGAAAEAGNGKKGVVKKRRKK